MDDIEEIDNPEWEDYYAFLNLKKDASQEDISSAYKNLSRIFHPDKHIDPAKKAEADILFNRTKKAYEVLSNKEQRAIYDCLGPSALKSDGWELISRNASPNEIREEYERLKKEKEERRLQQLTNPRGNITLNINATDIFNSYDYYDEPALFSRIEISGMNMFQSIEAPLTNNNVGTLSGSLNVRNGSGNGVFTVAGRRLINKGWVEADISAGNGLALGAKCSRNFRKRIFTTANLNFNFRQNGMVPGLVGTLAVQLDKHTVGYLTYTAGLQSSMATIVEHNTEKNYLHLMLLLGVPHSFVSFNYTRKMVEYELKLKLSCKVGTFGFMTEYGAEKKVSKYSSLHASVVFGVPTGVQLKIRFNRSSQSYNFHIQLSDEIIPAALFYATITPLISWFVLKKCIIEPIVSERQKREIDKKKEMNEQKIQLKKREAEAAVSLMSAHYERSCNDENKKNGLIILYAYYGKFEGGYGQESLEEIVPENDRNIIDVKIPLQCLVKESQLLIHTAYKSELSGFYDPCIGEEKILMIEYLYNKVVHRTSIKDRDEVKLPQTE